MAGEYVVAVHLDPGEAEPAGALVQRHAALPVLRRGDRPLVVLAEEDHGGVEDGRPRERLADVALASGAVAEVHDRGLVVRAIALQAHGVPGGVQRLVADNDRVQVELVLFRVPASVVHAPEEREEPHRIQATAPGDAVLAIGREGHVPGGQRTGGADLGGLLAQQRGPQAELALALQGDGLGIDPAHQDHVAVHSRDVRTVIERIRGVLYPLALGGQELY